MGRNKAAGAPAARTRVRHATAMQRRLRQDGGFETIKVRCICTSRYRDNVIEHIIFWVRGKDMRQMDMPLPGSGGRFH
jgi:hypothetical protein